MAQGPAPHTPSFFGLMAALTVAVYVSTVILVSLQLFFLPFVFLGTGGAIIGGALAAAIVFSIQRSIVGSISRWHPPAVLLFATALPGLLIALLIIHNGGSVVLAPLPGVVLQTVLLGFFIPQPTLE